MNDSDDARTNGEGAREKSFDPRRRSLLRWIPAAVFASVVGTVVAAAYRFLRPAASVGGAQNAAEAWADVTPLSEIDGGEPQLRKVAVEKSAGWAVVREERAVYVLEGPGREVVSAVCPHEQCEVAWSAESKVFQCPCHDSSFDPRGRRLGGPAPRDLAPVPSRVEAGRLQIMIEDSARDS